MVSILHQSVGNYYHWTAEGATRLLLSLDYFFGDNGVAKDAKLLIPPASENAKIRSFPLISSDQLF